MSNEPNVVRLAPSQYLTRRECFVCGGLSEKDTILAVIEGSDGEAIVCRACLAAGAAAIRACENMRHLRWFASWTTCKWARLALADAARLERRAAEPWVLPTLAEFDAMIVEFETRTARGGARGVDSARAVLGRDDGGRTGEGIKR